MLGDAVLTAQLGSVHNAAVAATRAAPRGGDDDGDDGMSWHPSGPGSLQCLASNFVTGLLEWSQKTPGSRVTFESVQASGPHHRPHFDASVVVEYADRAGGGRLQQQRFAGKSDVNAKAAKRAAARAACKAVMASDSDSERRIKSRLV
jgi:hypothetical protein